MLHRATFACGAAGCLVMVAAALGARRGDDVTPPPLPTTAEMDQLRARIASQQPAEGDDATPLVAEAARLALRTDGIIAVEGYKDIHDPGNGRIMADFDWLIHPESAWLPSGVDRANATPFYRRAAEIHLGEVLSQEALNLLSKAAAAPRAMPSLAPAATMLDCSSLGFDASMGQARLGRALAARLHMAIERHDGVEAAHTLAMLVSVARVQIWHPNMVMRLMGESKRSRIVRIVCDSITSGMMTPEVAAELLTELNRQPLGAPRSLSLELERIDAPHHLWVAFMTDNELIAQFGDRGREEIAARESAAPIAAVLIGSAPSIQGHDRAEFATMRDRYIECVGRLARAVDSGVDTRSDQLNAVWGWAEEHEQGAPGILHYASLTRRLSRSCDTTETQWLGMKVMLALEVYHGRHGRYPDSLGELVPELVDSMPRDQIRGRPLGYRVLTAEERAALARPYILYAFGADGEDNGGRLAENEYDMADTKDALKGFDFDLNRPRGWKSANLHEAKDARAPKEMP